MHTITEKDAQTVTESFNAVIAELNSIADYIKLSGAEAMMDGNYHKVDVSKTSAMVLKDFIQEANNLSTRWNKGIFSKSKTVQKNILDKIKDFPYDIYVYNNTARNDNL